MVDKTIEELRVTDAITDPGGTTHTDTISSGGGSGTSWGHSGSVAPSSRVMLYSTDVTDGSDVSASTVTAINSDGSPLVSNVTVDMGTIDESGSISVTNTLITGDGSTQYINESVDATYTNDSGGVETIAITVHNNNSDSIGIFTSGVVEVV